MPLLVGIAVVAIAPRPYYLSEMDIEHDYYYNARLLRDGLPVGSEHHPGTPIYYVSAQLLRLAGEGPAGAERFFALGYLLVAVASAAALFVFARTVLGEAGNAAFLLAMGLVLAWPPTLTYWSHYGADSFTIPVGLLLAAAVWKALATRGGPSLRWSIAAGFAAGLASAVKLTFLPLALCLLAAAAAHGLREWWAAGRRAGAPPRRPLGTVAAIGAAPLGMAVGGLLGTLPVVGRLPAILVSSAARPEVRPPAGRLLPAISEVQGWLWEWNPMLVILQILALALFTVALFRAWRLPAASPRAPESRFDFATGGVLIALLGAVLLYTLACSVTVTPGAEPGVRLRNAAPAGLALPLMVAYADRVRRAGRAPSRGRGRWVLAAAGVAAVAWGAFSFFAARAEFIRRHEDRATRTLATLRELAGPAATLAFWTESDDDHLGEASFHHWGNYRYGHGRYSWELERKYPGVTFLRLRDLRHLDESRRPAPTRAGSRFGAAGQLAWRGLRWWSEAFGSTRNPYVDSSALFTGHGGGAGTLFAFPETEIRELGRPGWPELLRRIEEGHGRARVARARIADVWWRLIYTGPDPLPGEARS